MLPSGFRVWGLGYREDEQMYTSYAKVVFGMREACPCRKDHSLFLECASSISGTLPRLALGRPLRLTPGSAPNHLVAGCGPSRAQCERYCTWGSRELIAQQKPFNRSIFLCIPTETNLKKLRQKTGMDKKLFGRGRTFVAHEWRAQQHAAYRKSLDTYQKAHTWTRSQQNSEKSYSGYITF